MRRVAAELGVDVAALYRHFENKSELVEHVWHPASEGVELPKAETGPWRDRCLALSEAIREGIRSHPELGFYGGGSAGANPFNARANGALASVLFDAGLRERELLLSTQALLHQMTAVAESGVLARATPQSGMFDFGITQWNTEITRYRDTLFCIEVLFLMDGITARSIHQAITFNGLD